jgi:hypothetical protein
MAIELTGDQQTELSEALIAADDVLNVLKEHGTNGFPSLRRMQDVYAAWQKVRGCAWLYEHQWYAERGIGVNVDDLKAAHMEDE